MIFMFKCSCSGCFCDFLLCYLNSRLEPSTNPRLSPGFVAKAISGAMPIKVSSIFLVHQPRMFGFIWTLVSPFLSSKIRGRVKMLGGSPASIFGELPAGVVSAEIGGAMQVDAAACAVQLQQLQQQRDGHVHAHLF